MSYVPLLYVPLDDFIVNMRSRSIVDALQMIAFKSVFLSLSVFIFIVCPLFS